MPAARDPRPASASRSELIRWTSPVTAFSASTRTPTSIEVYLTMVCVDEKGNPTPVPPLDTSG